MTNHEELSELVFPKSKRQRLKGAYGPSRPTDARRSRFFQPQATVHTCAPIGRIWSINAGIRLETTGNQPEPERSAVRVLGVLSLRISLRMGVLSLRKSSVFFATTGRHCLLVRFVRKSRASREFRRLAFSQVGCPNSFLFPILFFQSTRIPGRVVRSLHTDTIASRALSDRR